ncbi:MAG: permease-like cell division protein FtsX [Clostridia bacterium]|nr:permease-like cell division protein FtsX [Clostridia bacterium]
MKPRTVRTLSLQAIRNLKKTPAITCIAIVAACMFLLGAFLVTAVNLTDLGRQLRTQVQIRVFLAPGLAQARVDGLGKAIRATPGVGSVDYVGKQEALERLGRQLADYRSILNDLPANPLPESFDVSLRKAEDVSSVAEALRKLDGVADLRYGQQYVEKLLKSLKIIWGVAGVVAILVAIGASLIVANTIKLSVFARRREIEIMKLVGATDAFILFPFVLEGISIGVIGSIVAAAVVYGGCFGLSRWIAAVAPFIPLVRDVARMWYVVLALFTFGGVVGLAGSAISTKRHLRV